MNIFKHKIGSFSYLIKIFSIFLFMILFAAYANTFAVFSPGQTLDPNCAPGIVGCIVEILPNQLGNNGKYLSTDGTIATWVSTPIGVTAYPASGIPNSTGSEWGTSYTTSGSGNVLALATSPVFVTPTLGIATATSINNLPLLQDNIDFNIKVGQDAGLNLVAGSQFNTFIGYEAGKGGIGGTNAYYNTAVGYNSLYSNTTGNNNTASGTNSLYSNTTGNNNTANGEHSLFQNTTGYNNTANGGQSLFLNTTGGNNTASGNQSLYRNTTGYNNTANGESSLAQNTTGYYNTANGSRSLLFNTTGSHNTANGMLSGMFIADGITGNTTGSNSLFLGYDTRAQADAQTNQIVIGASAIGNGSNTATIGNNNLLRTYLTGLNLKAGTVTAGTAPLKLTSGTNLTTTEAGAVEYDGSHLYFTATDAGVRYQLDQQGGGGGLSSDADFNTKGGTNAGLNLVAGAQYNTFLGYEAGKSDGAGGTNTADNNIAIGYQALYENTTGDSNIANGVRSLFHNTTGYSNTANGYESLLFNTTGSNNIANGYQSLYGNITGNANTASGNNSLFYNSTGSNNTANGYESLFYNSTGSNNTANGMYSLTSNTTGNQNSALGMNTLYSNTTGSQNTANGYNSLYSNTIGSYNSVLGMYAGRYIANGTTGRITGDNGLYLGYNSKASADGTDNEIVIGASAIGNGSNTTTLGTNNVLYVGSSGISGMVARFTNNAGYCDINPLTASLVCSSDFNLKKNITTLDDKEFILQTVPIMVTSTLDKILALTPVTYNWKNIENDSKHPGFIAQDMENYFPELVSTDTKMDPVTGKYLKSIAYANLTPYLVKAIQEMNLKIEGINNFEVDENGNSVVNSWRDSMVAWFGNTKNGIIEFVGVTIRAKDKLCVGEGNEEVCITKEDLLQIKNNASLKKDDVLIKIEPSIENIDLVIPDKIVPETTPAVEVIKEIVKDVVPNKEAVPAEVVVKEVIATPQE